MTDVDLSREFATLDPEAPARARIAARLERDLEASRTSLAAEWLDLIKVRPVSALGYAAVAAGVLLLTTPLGSLSLLLLG